MVKQILFFHSAGSQGPHEGSSDFVAYLRHSLNREYEIRYPIMPDPDEPRYEPWKAVVKKELEASMPGALLIGHSLGGSVLLKYLSEEKYTRSIGGLFLVAVPYWSRKGWETDEYVLDANFAASLPRISPIILYHSKDDENVPVDHTRAYARKIANAKVVELEGSEHEFGNGLPELVADIKNLSNY